MSYGNFHYCELVGFGKPLHIATIQGTASGKPDHLYLHDGQEAFTIAQADLVKLVPQEGDIVKFGKREPGMETLPDYAMVIGRSANGLEADVCDGMAPHEAHTVPMEYIYVVKRERDESDLCKRFDSMYDEIEHVPTAKPRLKALLHSGLDPVTKDTNPKDALAGFKPRWFSFLPLQVLIGVGKAMFEGGWKYGKHNYRQSGVRASVYVDAAVCGHLMPWMEGEDCDENGMNHIEKAIASLMVLRDSQINGNWIDDRPLAAVNFAAHMKAETAHFQTMKAELQTKHGDPVKPYTQADQTR